MSCDHTIYNRLLSPGPGGWTAAAVWSVAETGLCECLGAFIDPSDGRRSFLPVTPGSAVHTGLARVDGLSRHSTERSEQQHSQNSHCINTDPASAEKDSSGLNFRVKINRRPEL